MTAIFRMSGELCGVYNIKGVEKRGKNLIMSFYMDCKPLKLPTASCEVIVAEDYDYSLPDDKKQEMINNNGGQHNEQYSNRNEKPTKGCT